MLLKIEQSSRPYLASLCHIPFHLQRFTVHEGGSGAGGSFAGPCCCSVRSVNHHQVEGSSPSKERGIPDGEVGWPGEVHDESV